MNDMLHDLLVEVRLEHPTLFLADITSRPDIRRQVQRLPFDITSRPDIEDKYNVFRSFRCGSDSRAIAMQVSALDIEVVNRWQKKEGAGTARANHSMKHHYADTNILFPNFIRYTKVM
jgi:hypothetical protein